MSEESQPEIVICMGSSCFARGNELNLEIIEETLKRRGLSRYVELRGCRCMGECSKGPNVRIGDRTHHFVDEGSLIDLLEEGLSAKGSAER